MLVSNPSSSFSVSRRKLLVQTCAIQMILKIDLHVQIVKITARTDSQNKDAKLPRACVEGRTGRGRCDHYRWVLRYKTHTQTYTHTHIYTYIDI